MATTTYTLIAKQTVGSGGASSVTFSSIPQNFTDLKIVYSARSSAAVDGDSAVIRFNGDTTVGNYAGKRILGAGSGTPSSASTTTGLTITGGANNTASTFSNGEIYIPNYTGSTSKSVSIDSVNETNGTTAYAVLGAMLWSGTSNINTLTLTLETGPNFVEFSTFYLYGISNSSTQIASNIPYALGGDVIVNDGTYWYHAFKYSGTFTPLKGLTADVLVIAGGGGGGSRHAGGGGAGGVCYQSSRSLTASTSYNATIGAGGLGNISPAAPYNGLGGNGTNSVFDTITAIGGGGGGGGGQSAANGGSGGGGTGNIGATPNGTAGGTSTQTNSGGATGYGNAGGAGVYNGTDFIGGGGGGAGVAGSIGSGNGGAGGNGLNTWSSWATATSTGVSGYYAGGGGGAIYKSTGTSTGGLGGGGGGVATGTAGAGVANTGSGGGGGGYDYTLTVNGGNGGSGLVIIRYAI